VLRDKANPRYRDYVAMMRELVRLLRSDRPDAVLAFMPLAAVTGTMAGLLAGVRARIVSHRVPVWSIRQPLRLLDAVWAWTGVFTRVVTVSEGVRASCHHYPRSLRARVSTVHNGLRDWRPSALDRTGARDAFGIPKNRFTLAAVGRLAEQKNYPLLFRVMERLPDALLLIAGEGPLRVELESEATRRGLTERIRFLGALPRTIIPDLLAAADVFVQPSIFEGQSNAILEALQAGLPGVAHDILEQRETVSDSTGTAGALVPVDNVGAWAEAIAQLGSDAVASSRAREVARRRARHFTYDRMIDGFERVVLDGPSALG
jgi:glycosyltransferase involved in cell wall biosynthesis